MIPEAGIDFHIQGSNGFSMEVKPDSKLTSIIVSSYGHEFLLGIKRAPPAHFVSYLFNETLCLVGIKQSTIAVLMLKGQ